VIIAMKDETPFAIKVFRNGNGMGMMTIFLGKSVSSSPFFVKSCFKPMKVIT